MVEQASAKDEAPDIAHGEPVERKGSQCNKVLKKKGSRGNNVDRKTEDVLSYLGKSDFVTRDSLHFYLKAIKSLGLYVCTTYKNGSDVQICLDSKKQVLSEEAVMPKNYQISA